MSDPIDRIGQWSVDKLEILSSYLEGYATVLRKQSSLKPIYIDAFSSSGIHVHRDTGEVVEGSPFRALKHDDVFHHFHFIDLDEGKVELLKTGAGGRPDVSIHHGDCNEVVVKEVLPRYPYEQFYRVLAFVDPYGMHISWELIAALGRMKGAEMFLHFPIADINRNALHRRGVNPDQSQQARLTRLWGDESWKSSLYQTYSQTNLFGEDDLVSQKAGNRRVVDAFRQHLKEVAGFSEVPEAAPVAGPSGNVIYYLIFAGHNGTGAKIASHILKRYSMLRR
jgi:hypothetical protein